MAHPVVSSGVAYQVGPGSEVMNFQITVTNASQRLGALLTVPSLADPFGPKRPPKHVTFQLPPAATNTVTMTTDDVTTAVSLGPGLILTAGTIFKFENVGNTLLAGGSVYGTHTINANTAFQLIASAASQLLNVNFYD